MSTKIEWIDETWNPVTGCTPVSAGCANCYAERMARRLAGRHGYPETPHHFDVTLHPDRLDNPLHWKKPRRVFVSSMSDLFHKSVPNNFRAQIFDVMAAAEHHTFQVLTKRPENIRDWEQWMDEYWPGDSAWQVVTETLNRWPDNVWLGVTAENQVAADERIPTLLRIPAAVRFVSVEPMLGQVNLGFVCLECDTYHHYSEFVYTEGACPTEDCMGGYNQQFEELNWVIAGGETGPSARPAHPDWFRAIRNQCVAAGVPFFFKQWGEFIARDVWKIAGEPEYKKWGCLDITGDYRPLTTTWNGRQYDPQDDYEVTVMRVGKKAAGHLLDGQEWRQFPDERR